MIKHFCDECGRELGPDHGFFLTADTRNGTGPGTVNPKKELCSIACANLYLIGAMGSREPRQETWP